MDIGNTNLTQSILDLNLWHQRVNDICILKNSELFGRLHSLECGVGSRYGKGCKFQKTVYKGATGAWHMC